MAGFGNKNALGHDGSGTGRPVGSISSPASFVKAGIKEKQAEALGLLLEYILHGDVPDKPGFARWKELLRKKMDLALGKIRMAREINGELVTIYNKAPESASIDWLIQWIVGRQPEIVKVSGDAENPLWLSELSDGAIKQRIADELKAAISRIKAEGDGAKGPGGSDLLDTSNPVSGGEVSAIQTAGQDPHASNGVSTPAQGEAESESDKKDNGDIVIAEGTSQVNVGDDKLDASASDNEPERPGIPDERETGQREKVSGSD